MLPGRGTMLEVRLKDAAAVSDLGVRLPAGECSVQALDREREHLAGRGVLVHAGEVLGVFPEGIRGAFTLYKRAYTLGKFGRDEFVRMALRNRAPILPFVTVGSAEIYPILRRVDWRWFKRYTEWPFLPITAAPFPLPSKWHTRFLPALHVEEQYPPEAAEDPMLMFNLTDQVREQIQHTLYKLLVQRRSVFF